MEKLQVRNLLVDLLDHLDLLLIGRVRARTMAPSIPIELLVNLRIKRSIPSILLIDRVLQSIISNFVSFNLGFLLKHGCCSRSGQSLGPNRSCTLLMARLVSHFVGREGS